MLQVPSHSALCIPSVSEFLKDNAALTRIKKSSPNIFITICTNYNSKLRLRRQPPFRRAALGFTYLPVVLLEQASIKRHQLTSLYRTLAKLWVGIDVP